MERNDERYGDWIVAVENNDWYVTSAINDAPVISAFNHEAATAIAICLAENAV